MMNVLRSMFGVCSSSAEKGEVHDMIKKIFGNDLVMKDNTDRHNQRTKYVSHIRDNLPKMLDAKILNTKLKSKKNTQAVTEGTESTDERPGRIGPKIVVFDASTGTGRLVLVGDERVSVQGLSSFATIKATACVYAGKWMYEVQLGTKGIMQVGWCTAACTFSMDTGVGDTAHSYGYDGGRVRKWNVATTPYGYAWLPGDVIASCIDLDKGTLEYYRNGVSLGMAFDKVTHGTGLAYFPAVSLAMQEHLYANFGHVPFVFPIEGYSPLQAAPERDCAKAAILFRSVDALLNELTHLSTLKPNASAKTSKIKSNSSKVEEEVALRINSSNSVYSPRSSPHNMDVQGIDMKKMSRKAFLMSLARLVVIELGTVLKLSYVVVSELLPRFRVALGLNIKGFTQEQHAVDFFSKMRDRGFSGLSEKFLDQPQPRLCMLLELLWTFLDEAALCDILEHCVVRECLMFDMVSPDMNFTQQIEGIYVLCGLMQHRETRHHLVKYVFFNKITFDNFMNIKCPDDSVLKTVIRKSWWQRPTPVHGETDPRIAEKISKLRATTKDDAQLEAEYREDCDKITKAIAPLERVQNLFSNAPPHIPPRTFIDGELDFYNVDRLGGVLPFLVRTLRQDLINMLGEDNPFVQSFEPNYNRAGGIDTGTGVSEMAAGSPGLATLPQVISSMARFMNGTLPPMPNRTTGETALALKGARSMMPGAGSIEVRSAYLRLLDGLLALYHGTAIKHAEKLCELRDNQLDLADCLHDIEQRMQAVSVELQSSGGANGELSEQEKMRKVLMEKILKELDRSKAVYVEKLESSALQMGWVIGAIWTKQRQQELAKHFTGTLHSLRLASDPDYASMQVASKEILPGKSSLLGKNSYESLQLEYTSSSDQSPLSPPSRTETPRAVSHSQLDGRTGTQEFAESLFAFIPDYHVDAMLELCNTLRLYMHPTVPIHQISEWDDLVVSCAAFLCSEFADSRIVLASTRESLVQTLASFATQPATMRAIERVPLKQQMAMIEELVRPYQNRAWAQSNWVLVRFWHGSGFGFRHRQWPHLAARYGDREPTVNNLGAKVDAGLMSPCPSEVIQSRIRDYLSTHPKQAALFLNSLLSQLNWAFSEFFTMMQEMDRIQIDTHLEPRQIKLCATCFDLYHGLARALEMTMSLAPMLLTKAEASDGQNDLLLGRTCQILMAVISRICVRGGGSGGFSRLVSRGLPDTDRVHYYVALAPVAGCIVKILDPKLPVEHLTKAKTSLITEPLFRIDGMEFMISKNNKQFSFYKSKQLRWKAGMPLTPSTLLTFKGTVPDDVKKEELKALEAAIDQLRSARDNYLKTRSPGSSGAQSDLLCTICYARPADTAFVPCGHHSCRACIMQHLLNSKQCFFCKADIDTVHEIEVVNN
ncbi:unnamed protein product [Pieris brassicae]|uniref:RING-type E3 ubiquitin transferase n=1 Tax=Pieris brassicae TaxID=7116 RepID=A0A9P0X2T1_PIEBR|nr:unnamed protein product [Pieris brassicae]